MRNLGAGVSIIVLGTLVGCSEPSPAPSTSASSARASSSTRPSAARVAPTASSIAPSAVPSSKAAGPKGEIDGKPVEYSVAVAWQLRPTAALVILSNQGSCETLKPIERDRGAFDPTRLDVLYTDTLEANGTRRSRPTGVLPLAGISGKLDGTLTERDASKPVVGTIDLDFYEKEGPTIKLSGPIQAQPCGQWTGQGAGPAPQSEPDLKVEYGGKAFTIRGAVANVYEDGAAIVTLSTSPLACGNGSDLDGADLILQAGRFSAAATLSVDVSGDAVPRGGGVWIDPDSAKVQSTFPASRQPDESETTATLDWSFSRGTFDVRVSGKATVKLCENGSSGLPAASATPSAGPVR
ncbi:MAG: hypothetical protein U0271_44570 [Polyangiaceae bacterium]